MSDRSSFLQSLPVLRNQLKQPSAEVDLIIQKANIANPWFIPDFVKQAIQAIADEFLDETKCSAWLSHYPMCNGQKKVAIIMAGNLPLVGFHDLLCVLASGHHALIKLSDKDNQLLPWIIARWIEIYPELSYRISYIDRLEGFDAVIATGSNNSGRYFEYYFRSYPHILRQNRNGIAVLTGKESFEELKKLARDIFLFFGFGCRNVSRIFLPEGYDFDQWNEAFAEWKALEDHHKYKNNLEYNFAILIINSIPHINLGQLILKEDEAIASRIGCLHYSYYSDLTSVFNVLNEKRTEIQCVISQVPVEGWEHVRFGESQQPRLDQYADGIDTMAFLNTI